jgi:hypothetical protein
MSKNLNNTKASVSGRRSTKPAKGKKKYIYPNMTFRPTAHEEMGLRLLKRRTKKPMGFYISQGIRIVLQRNNIKFPPLDNKTE